MTEVKKSENEEIKDVVDSEETTEEVDEVEENIEEKTEGEDVTEDNEEVKEEEMETEKIEEVKEEEKKDNSQRNTIIAIVIAVALIVAVFLGTGNNSSAPDALKGEVIASVNGEVIYESELTTQLDQILSQYAGQGQEISEEIQSQVRLDTINALIGQKLIMQEAERLNLLATDEEVADAYTNEVIPTYGSEENLTEVLTSAGITKDDLLLDIKQQLTMQNFIADQIDTTSILISDEDAQALYDETALTTENLPPFEEVIDEIKVSLQQQAVTEKVLALVDELREQAEVEVI